MPQQSIASMAAATLDKCEEVLTELHDNCCVPNRSPRMKALETTLASVREQLGNVEAEPETGDAIIASLRKAGAEIGELQIECCAPSRMPLYADLLAGLSRTQRMVTAANGGMEH